METNDDFRIEVAAPGMKRNDFKVELDNFFVPALNELLGTNR